MAFNALSNEARSLRHRVAETLREAIVCGQMVPGHRLLEEEVSEQMQISRGTVREAFRQLEQEGLIVSFPYRGTVVVGVSEEEVREVLVPIRITLEGYVFSHALDRFAETDFLELERIVGEMKLAAETGDVKKIVEADMRFHEIILKKSQQTHSLQIWNLIAPRIKTYLFGFYRAHPEQAKLSEIEEQHGSCSA